MGPTLRSTPLSPACGSRGTLDARRPDAGSDKLLRALKVGFGFARRSRRRRFRRGSGSIARIGLLPPGGSETVPVDLGLIAASALPEGSTKSSAPGRQTRPFRLCALAASTVWDLVRTRTNLGAFRFSSLHRAAFAIASIRFQNPFFLAGLSAFVSEGPIPVSMIGRCAVQPIRATAGPPSYPLSG